MQRTTRELWTRQDQHPGDRYRLFRAVAAAAPARTVLYPGSYVDLAPSFVFPAVTYVDVDRRAARFFADRDGVLELIAEQRALLEPAERPTAPADPSADPARTVHRVPQVAFLAADYTADLGLRDGSFDLLSRFTPVRLRGVHPLPPPRRHAARQPQPRRRRTRLARPALPAHGRRRRPGRGLPDHHR